MTTTTALPFSVATILRGNPSNRPVRDDTTAALLHDHLVAAVRRTTVGLPVVVRAATLRGPLPTLQSSTIGRFRGLLVTTALRLLVNGIHLDDLFVDPLEAWRSTCSDGALLQQLEDLDADQSARLAAEVRAHVNVLRTHVGPVPSAWRPRTGVRSTLLLDGGALQLRDDVDLQIGTQRSDVASIALLDMTTEPLSPASEQLLRYHALVHTLKTNVVPLRTALFSTATGELWTRDVDRTLLEAAVADLTDHVTSLAVAA